QLSKGFLGAPRRPREVLDISRTLHLIPTEAVDITERRGRHLGDDFFSGRIARRGCRVLRQPIVGGVRELVKKHALGVSAEDDFLTVRGVVSAPFSRRRGVSDRYAEGPRYVDERGQLRGIVGGERRALRVLYPESRRRRKADENIPGDFLARLLVNLRLRDHARDEDVECLRTFFHPAADGLPVPESAGVHGTGGDHQRLIPRTPAGGRCV